MYADSSLGNVGGSSTQGGYLIFLVGLNQHFSPICWSSRKVRRVVRSTIAGETLAMVDAIDTAIYLANLFTEIQYGKADPKLVPIVCITDCRSLYEAVHSTKTVTEKRLRLELSSIKEGIQSGLIWKFLWTGGFGQLADCLTKKGASVSKLLSVLERGVVDKMF